jgi:hypothetical protein
MANVDRKQPSRRGLMAVLIGAALGGVTLAASVQPAAAKPWGAPPGWSRGRKRGWAKKGGPKWRW